MATLNDSLHGMVSAEALTQLATALTKSQAADTFETVTSGALSLSAGVSFISISGTKAYTLANGTYVGQRKTIIVTVAASTPDGTLTPATFANGTSIDIDAVNESATLFWNGSTWTLLGITGAFVNA